LKRAFGEVRPDHVAGFFLGLLEFGQQPGPPLGDFFAVKHRGRDYLFEQQQHLVGVGGGKRAADVGRLGGSVGTQAGPQEVNLLLDLVLGQFPGAEGQRLGREEGQAGLVAVVNRPGRNTAVTYTSGTSCCSIRYTVRPFLSFTFS
jgi:hypothetical protein